MLTAMEIIAKTIFFALPGIVAFLMAALALAVIYMDELQTKLRDQRAIRWIVAIVLIAMGIGAFVSDRVQKVQEQEDSAEKIMQTAVDTANDLSPKVAAETATQVTDRLNRDYGKVIGDLYKQIASLQTQQQSQAGLTRKQLALDYALSVDLIYAGDLLQIWNRGKTNIYLWGNKYGGATDFGKEPMQITPAGSYYLLTNVLQSVIHKQLGQNGEARVPFDLYLTSEDNKKYVAHNTLWEIVKDGTITIHTQTHGYESVAAWPSN
jgi:hypothetical protein